MRAAVRAAGALLSYLNDTQRRILSHITSLSVYSVESYMLMETTTRRNLELTETLRGGEHKGSFTMAPKMKRSPPWEAACCGSGYCSRDWTKGIVERLVQ